MKNLIIIVLVLLSAAAIISGLLFYGKYLDVKDTLSVSNQELLDLNERLAQSNKENSRLNDQINQIKESAEGLRDLEGAQLRISQLEDEIRVKDQTLSGLDERLAQLGEENSRLNDQINQIRESAEGLRDLEGAKVRISQLEDEIRVNDQTISGLEERLAQLGEENSRLNDQINQIRESAEDLRDLEGARSSISQLEDELKIKDQTLSRLDVEISRLEEGSKDEKRIGESLRKELVSKDEMVAALQERIERERSMAETKTEELRSTYESLISGLERQLKNKEMSIREFEEKLSITFVDKVLFDFGKAAITPKGRGILKRVGSSLKKIPGMQIRVVGHTDNKAIRSEYQYKFPSNWELSSARAAAVVRLFQRETGLDPESFEVVGRSFYNPVASNETKEGRAKNRRVEVIIGPKIK